MFDINGIGIIILDFDGVVVESNGIKDEVIKDIFSRFPEHSEDFWQYHKKYISVSRYQKFDYVLQKTGREGDMAFRNRLLEDFSRGTLKRMRSVAFVKGAKEFLIEMHDRLPLYLASVTPIEDLEIILEDLQLRRFFKNVYGCPPWSKPDAIRDILKTENLLPGKAVLVGDSYGDQRAAKDTGVHFIGRDSGLGFEEPYPATVIPDLNSLLQLFKKTNGQ